MISGYGEKEREFLDSLKADTGRDLDEWMIEIRGQALTERNAIIDWLRRQGFRFSRASWLERIYHNGGKPIYAGQVDDARTKVRVPRPERRRAAEHQPSRHAGPGVLGSSAPVQPAANDTMPLASVSPAAPRPASDLYGSVASSPSPVPKTAGPLSPEIAAIIAKAKAYRPLAEMLLQDVAKAVPDASFTAAGQQVSMTRAQTFATLAVSARGLKLSIAGGETISLTDARQINEALGIRLRSAAQSAG